MKEDLRKEMIKKARENGEKHGKTAELDFGAGAEWMHDNLVKNNAVLSPVSDCIIEFLKWRNGELPHKQIKTEVESFLADYRDL